MLALSPAAIRQNRLWLPSLKEPTVTFVAEDQSRAFKRAFAATLLGLRAESGIGAQGDLAEKAGVSQATYARWENGNEPNLPDAWEINRLCVALDCEPDELVRPQPPTRREEELLRRLARSTKRGGRRASADE